jgi:hypothetical protein
VPGTGSCVTSGRSGACDCCAADVVVGSGGDFGLVSSINCVVAVSEVIVGIIGVGDLPVGVIGCIVTSSVDDAVVPGGDVVGCIVTSASEPENRVCFAARCCGVDGLGGVALTSVSVGC